MSDETNTAAVRRLFAAFETADPAAVDRELGPDFVAHGPGGRTDDAEGWKAMSRMLLDAMPDLRVTLDEVLASGDRVTARFTSRGTHKGELFGVPASDAPLTTGGIEIYRLEAGRIVECWGAYDMTELFGSGC
jgi:predicted ester cyclase